MSKIVFASCDALPEFSASDAILAKALEARGASVAQASWSGPQAPFEESDLVVLRATWDYAPRHEAFAAWLAGLESHKAVVNAPRLMRWNMDKTYLLELAEKGAPLPPTRAVRPDASSIAEGLDALRLERAIVKPVFGAGASGLSIVDANDAAGLERAAAKLVEDGGNYMGGNDVGNAGGDGRGLVQALIPEVETAGETSLMFVDGEFTHAVVKRPKAGDIRVQEEHGGRTEPVDPPAFAVEAAAGLFDLLPEPAVYARIDAVIFDKTFLLMEVELIEPELFFTYFPTTGAAERFADALVKRL